MNFPSPSSFLFYWKAMYWGIGRKSFLKSPTNFWSTHVRICVKDATPLGSRPYSWAIWDFWFDGSMVQWFNGSMVQSARWPISKCLAAAPFFLFRATRHFVLFSLCEFKVAEHSLTVCAYMSFAKSRQGKDCSSQAETWQVKNILMEAF